MYKILITGGTGFIGSHLHKYLANLGYDCDTINKQDFMSTNFYQLDEFKPDIVVHCAWPRSTDLHANDHLEFAEMSCNFSSECKKRGIRVINIGSSSEYGPILEARREDMACFPNTTYGIGKLTVTLFAKKLGFNTLRLFTVTGEGGHNFKDIAKESKKWSDRKQVRDYVSIETVCLAVQRLIHAEHLYGEIINVGSGVAFRNSQVAGILENTLKFTSKAPPWDKYPQTQFEPSNWQADTTKMKQLLNI